MNNWFVKSFVIFLFCIPVIERSIQNIDKQTLRKFVVLLTILNVVFGWGLKQLNENGYNALNFIYIYYIGRYIKMLSQEQYYIKYAKHGYLLWILSGISLTTIYIIYSAHFEWSSEMTKRLFGYNNPFVIASAIGIFVTFSTIKIQSNKINQIAKTVFGIFLLHTTSLFIEFRRTTIREFYLDNGYIGLLFVAIIIFIVCVFISLFIENSKVAFFKVIRKFK